MAAFSTVLAAAGAAATIGGTVYQLKQAKAARQAQDKATKAREKQQAAAARRERRQAIRQAQVARAQSIATAQSSGGLNSSAGSGGIGAISSQLGEAIGYQNVQSNLSSQINDAQTSFNRASAASNRGGQFASLGSSVFRFGVNRGGLDRFLTTPQTVTPLSNPIPSSFA